MRTRTARPRPVGRYSAGQAPRCRTRRRARSRRETAYAIEAARHAAPDDASDAAGRLVCRWPRDQFPDAVRGLVLDDQQMQNNIGSIAVQGLESAGQLARVRRRLLHRRRAPTAQASTTKPTLRRACRGWGSRDGLDQPVQSCSDIVVMYWSLDRDDSPPARRSAGAAPRSAWLAAVTGDIVGEPAFLFLSADPGSGAARLAAAVADQQDVGCGRLAAAVNVAGPEASMMRHRLLCAPATRMEPGPTEVDVLAGSGGQFVRRLGAAERGRDLVG